MRSLRRGVRVQVYPRGRVGVGLAGDDPVGGVEGVTVALVVHRGEVHHEHVVLQRVHPVYPHLVRGKHAPVSGGRGRFHSASKIPLRGHQCHHVIYIPYNKVKILLDYKFQVQLGPQTRFRLICEK